MVRWFVFLAASAVGGHKHASASMRELTIPNKGWDEPSSSGTHKQVPQKMNREEASITPEEWDVLLAFRKAEKGLTPEFH